MTAHKLVVAVAVAFSLSLAANAEEAPAARKAAPAAEKPAASKSKPAADELSDTSGDDARPIVRKKSSGTAKKGEACKVNEDCAGEMVCGRGKCEFNLSQAHPAT